MDVNRTKKSWTTQEKIQIAQYTLDSVKQSNFNRKRLKSHLTQMAQDLKLDADYRQLKNCFEAMEHKYKHIRNWMLANGATVNDEAVQDLINRTCQFYNIFDQVYASGHSNTVPSLHPTKRGSKSRECEPESEDVGCSDSSSSIQDASNQSDGIGRKAVKRNEERKKWTDEEKIQIAQYTLDRLNESKFDRRNLRPHLLQMMEDFNLTADYKQLKNCFEAMELKYRQVREWINTTDSDQQSIDDLINRTCQFYNIFDQVYSNVHPSKIPIPHPRIRSSKSRELETESEDVGPSDSSSSVQDASNQSSGNRRKAVKTKRLEERKKWTDEEKIQIAQYTLDRLKESKFDRKNLRSHLERMLQDLKLNAGYIQLKNCFEAMEQKYRKVREWINTTGTDLDQQSIDELIMKTCSYFYILDETYGVNPRKQPVNLNSNVPKSREMETEQRYFSFVSNSKFEMNEIPDIDPSSTNSSFENFASLNEIVVEKENGEKINRKWNNQEKIRIAQYTLDRYRESKFDRNKLRPHLLQMIQDLNLDVDFKQLKNCFGRMEQKHKEIRTSIDANEANFDEELIEAYINKRCPYFYAFDEVFGSEPRRRNPSAPLTTKQNMTNTSYGLRSRKNSDSVKATHNTEAENLYSDLESNLEFNDETPDSDLLRTVRGLEDQLNWTSKVLNTVCNWITGKFGCDDDLPKEILKPEYRGKDDADNSTLNTNTQDQNFTTYFVPPESENLGENPTAPSPNYILPFDFTTLPKEIVPRFARRRKQSFGKPEFTCTICDKEFNNQETLKKHQMGHCYVKLARMDMECLDFGLGRTEYENEEFNSHSDFEFVEVENDNDNAKDSSDSGDKATTTTKPKRIVFKKCQNVFEKEAAKLKQKQKLISCRECRFKFSGDHLAVHMEKFHSNLQMSNIQNEFCKICGFLTRGPNRLIRHIKTKHSRQYAEAIGNREDLLLIWEQIYSNETCCRSCKIKFNTPEELDAHKKDHHNFNCNICSKPYETRKGLKRHIVENHEKTQADLVHVPCSICGQLIKKPSILRHLASEHGQSRYQCSQCPFKAYDRLVLKYHLINVHGQTKKKKPPVQCHLCGEIVNARGIQKHIKCVHYGIRNYPCSICEKRFKSSQSLKAHLKSHQNPSTRKRGLGKERVYKRRRPNLSKLSSSLLNNSSTIENVNPSAAN